MIIMMILYILITFSSIIFGAKHVVNLVVADVVLGGGGGDGVGPVVIALDVEGRVVVLPYSCPR